MPLKYDILRPFSAEAGIGSWYWILTTAMRPKLHVPAPSSSLLRYLKFQSEDCCFFGATRGGIAFDHGALRQTRPHTTQGLNTPISSSSHLWTPVPTRATCEASILNLDFLFPRVASPRSQLATGNARQRAREIKRSAELSVGKYRYASDDRSTGWLRRIFGRKGNRRRPLKGIDAPYGDESVDASMYALGRTMSVKAANEQKLRCTEFDENGNVVLVNGEFKKSELIAKVWHSSQDSHLHLY